MATRKPARHDDGRRVRSTVVRVAVPTTFKALGEQLGISAGTVAARYHRIHDMYPNRCVSIEALSESHKTAQHRGKYAPKPQRTKRT